ncbi:MAG: hypothetical protein ACI83D_000256 [Planctomycetota bacterium]|jgi:hypothetical protein
MKKKLASTGKLEHYSPRIQLTLLAIILMCASVISNKLKLFSNTPAPLSIQEQFGIGNTYASASIYFCVQYNTTAEILLKNDITEKVALAILAEATGPVTEDDLVRKLRLQNKLLDLLTLEDFSSLHRLCMTGDKEACILMDIYVQIIKVEPPQEPFRDKKLLEGSFRAYIWNFLSTQEVTKISHILQIGHMGMIEYQKSEEVAKIGRISVMEIDRYVKSNTPRDTYNEYLATDGYKAWRVK